MTKWSGQNQNVQGVESLDGRGRVFVCVRQSITRLSYPMCYKRVMETPFFPLTWGYLSHSPKTIKLLFFFSHLSHYASHPECAGNPSAWTSPAHSHSPLIHPAKTVELKQENNVLFLKWMKWNHNNWIKCETVIFVPCNTHTNCKPWKKKENIKSTMQKWHEQQCTIQH